MAEFMEVALVEESEHVTYAGTQKNVNVSFQERRAPYVIDSPSRMPEMTLALCFLLPTCSTHHSRNTSNPCLGFSSPWFLLALGSPRLGFSSPWVLLAL